MVGYNNAANNTIHFLTNPLFLMSQKLLVEPKQTFFYVNVVFGIRNARNYFEYLNDILHFCNFYHLQRGQDKSLSPT